MNDEALKAMLHQPEISGPLLLAMLVLAFVLGGIHALGPGHGKTLMAGYLVGSRGRLIDAVALAIIFTVSHVLTVVVLGFVALWIADFFMPERMAKWLALFSGGSIFMIGVWLLRLRWRFLQQLKQTGSVDLMPHTHAHDPEHPHEHHEHHEHHHDEHHHAPPPEAGLSFWNTLSLGISGGVVPCPKALVILLLAISLQKIVEGILIVAAFSFGIAVVLTAIGVILVKAAHLITDRMEDHRIYYLPLIGAVMISGLGVFLMARALWMFV